MQTFAVVLLVILASTFCSSSEEDEKKILENCNETDIKALNEQKNEACDVTNKKHIECLKDVSSRSFTVDYEGNSFLKDGKLFRYMSGSIHYFRVPHQYWKDRISKMKMAGFNTVQTYVEWSHHEPEPGVYSFDGDYNLTRFLKTAQDLDMLVILRPGPFIDAERDLGGLPYWLLRINPNMKFRTYDAEYIKYVDRWFNVLLPVIEPYLYNNGGPIITVQIENEYGSYGCDAQYKSHLRDLFRKVLKNKAVLFTTDGSASSLLTCGKTDQVLSTIDFGSGDNVTYRFEMLRWTQASGPLVNSEFYLGWLDHWGQPHATVATDGIVKTLTEMLKANASVNVYLFHGGTSFGFTAGSNLGDTFQACPTSYDYDAPLSEAGDPTPKYYAMREAIGKFFPLPPGPVPKHSLKMKLPPIPLQKKMSLREYALKSNKIVNSTYPLSFEQLAQPYGFVLYWTIVPFTPTDSAVLTVKGVADRAYVYVDSVPQGILSREQKIEAIPIQVAKDKEILIIVENQGRLCYGKINDRKGIFQNVTLGSQTLVNWTMVPIDLDPNSLSSIRDSNEKNRELPAFHSGQFVLPKGSVPLDSFLKVDGWHKGVAFLNGFNLGRYWPIIGPQVTLYAPSIHFKPYPANNTIVLLELEQSPSSAVVEFTDTHIINGTTPSFS